MRLGLSSGRSGPDMRANVSPAVAVAIWNAARELLGSADDSVLRYLVEHAPDPLVARVALVALDECGGCRLDAIRRLGEIIRVQSSEVRA